MQLFFVFVVGGGGQSQPHPRIGMNRGGEGYMPLGREGSIAWVTEGNKQRLGEGQGEYRIGDELVMVMKRTLTAKSHIDHKRALVIVTFRIALIVALDSFLFKPLRTLIMGGSHNHIVSANRPLGGAKMIDPFFPFNGGHFASGTDIVHGGGKGLTHSTHPPDGIMGGFKGVAQCQSSGEKIDLLGGSLGDDEQLRIQKIPILRGDLPIKSLDKASCIGHKVGKKGAYKGEKGQK